MGLAWQQGPLATGSVGHFLTPEPLPQRLLYAGPLRRRMRVQFADRSIAESEDVVLLHEPGRYPVAYFPEGDIKPNILFAEDRTTQHPELGNVAWFTVGVADRKAYESGFAPRWYVPRDDVDKSMLKAVEGQTFCPYKGLAGYYDIGSRKRAAWSSINAWPQVARVSDLVSFEPDKIDVYLDDRQLHLEPGQTVVSHGIDRGLDPDEILDAARTRPLGDLTAKPGRIG